MDDMHVAAAVLTLALHSAGHERTLKTGADHWQTVWEDYKKFLQELEKSDSSIDKRGIHPD
jgi:hypothetical protein